VQEIQDIDLRHSLFWTETMNINTPAALALLLLTSCAPLTWTKRGASTADFNSDKYACEQSSMTATPNTPILTNCNQYTGLCQTQDFNQWNRNQLFNDCMVAKGWSLQRIDNQAHPSSTPPPRGTTDSARPISKGSCESNPDPDWCRIFGPADRSSKQIADADVGMRNLAKAVVANPRMKQAWSEVNKCAKTYKDRFNESSQCINAAYDQAFTDVGYPWMDLIHEMHATRAALAAQLDAEKITKEYFEAKLKAKQAALIAEEIQRREQHGNE
jgi:hypothetical protein